MITSDMSIMKTALVIVKYSSLYLGIVLCLPGLFIILNFLLGYFIGILKLIKEYWKLRLQIIRHPYFQCLVFGLLLLLLSFIISKGGV